MEEPSSPPTNPVDLRDCTEELSLESRLNDTVQKLELHLSRDFCSNVLDDHPDSTSKSLLCKPLASALYGSITSGDDYSKQKEEPSKLLLDMGSELTNALKSSKFELHVQEPYFTQLRDGLKTVEGRCAVGDYLRIRSGDYILFNKSLVLEVQDVHHYASFSEMLATEGLAKVLPGVVSIEEGVQVYRKFYTEEEERFNGVLAILVGRPVS